MYDDHDHNETSSKNEVELSCSSTLSMRALACLVAFISSVKSMSVEWVMIPIPKEEGSSDNVTE